MIEKYHNNDDDSEDEGDSYLSWGWKKKKGENSTLPRHMRAYRVDADEEKKGSQIWKVVGIDQQSSARKALNLTRTHLFLHLSPSSFHFISTIRRKRKRQRSTTTHTHVSNTPLLHWQKSGEEGEEEEEKRGKRTTLSTPQVLPYRRNTITLYECV